MNGRSRPEAAPETAGKTSEPTLTPLDDVARHVDGAFVLVVHVTGGKYRRRCFLTAAAAEAAVQRATDRGEIATVYLAELKPLWKVRGGGTQ
ncbi:MAG: hypothetical protein ACRDPQ_16095 [Nocardioidaceae bacterium]